MKTILFLLVFALPLCGQTIPTPGTDAMAQYQSISALIGPDLHGYKGSGFIVWQRSLRHRLQANGYSSDLLTEATLFHSYVVQYHLN